MRRIASFIVNHKKIILAAYVVIIILSFIGLKFVSIEYDLSSYLPKSMNSIIGKDILEKDFDINGSAKLVIKSSNLDYVQDIKSDIKAL